MSATRSQRSRTRRSSSPASVCGNVTRARVNASPLVRPLHAFGSTLDLILYDTRPTTFAWASVRECHPKGYVANSALPLILCWVSVLKKVIASVVGFLRKSDETYIREFEEEDAVDESMPFGREDRSSGLWNEGPGNSPGSGG
jgi:hypothetical protein